MSGSVIGWVWSTVPAGVARGFGFGLRVLSGWGVVCVWAGRAAGSAPGLSMVMGCWLVDGWVWGLRSRGGAVRPRLGRVVRWRGCGGKDSGPALYALVCVAKRSGGIGVGLYVRMISWSTMRCRPLSSSRTVTGVFFRYLLTCSQRPVTAILPWVSVV